MKLAVMAYHANARALYDMAWIEQCVESVRSQTDMRFDIHELNYACEDDFFFGPFAHRYNFKLPTFVDAMNWFLDLLFAQGYDAVLNVNIDDYYALDRVEKQRAALEDGYDIVSSNFIGVGLSGEPEFAVTEFEHLDVAQELKKGHNPLAHGVIAYSKKFWDSGARYDPAEVPHEDQSLWEREIDKHRFVILPEALMYYRQHPKSVSARGFE